MNPKIAADIDAESIRQIGKGRTPEEDDARPRSDWFTCLSTLFYQLRGAVAASPAPWRLIWVKIARLAVSALESIDRHPPAEPSLAEALANQAAARGAYRRSSPRLTSASNETVDRQGAARKLARSILLDVQKHGDAGGGEEAGRKLYFVTVGERVDACIGGSIWEQERNKLAQEAAAAPPLPAVLEAQAAAASAHQAVEGRAALTSAHLVEVPDVAYEAALELLRAMQRQGSALSLRAGLVLRALDYESPRAQRDAVELLRAGRPG